MPQAGQIALEKICRPVVQAAGFDVILVEWTTDRGRRVLRVYLDNEETGVTVDDCAAVSRRLSRVLDVEDMIPSAYSLEVSTPGLDRPLAREKDFTRFAGRRAKVTLREPLPSGRRRLDGTVQGAENGRISMNVDGEVVSFSLQEMLKARLVYEGEL